MGQFLFEIEAYMCVTFNRTGNYYPNVTSYARSSYECRFQVREPLFVVNLVDAVGREKKI
jgi:hypothetical protein